MGHDNKNDEDIELTILMPCLNEAETLALCINDAQSFLERHGVKGEVLIADNGSTGAWIGSETSLVRMYAIQDH
jgi:hypothetical protein